MDIKEIEKKKIGKINSGVYDIDTKDLQKGYYIWKLIKGYFVSKFSLIIAMIDYSGNIKFYLVNPQSNHFKIENKTYWIKDDCIKKTNTKYSLICFNEGNPSPKDLSHEENDTITARQLTDFMDKKLVGMVLGYKKDKPFDFMIWLIVLGALLVVFLVVLQLTGVIDIAGFFIATR